MKWKEQAKKKLAIEQKVIGMRACARTRAQFGAPLFDLVSEKLIGTNAFNVIRGNNNKYSLAIYRSICVNKFRIEERERERRENDLCIWWDDEMRWDEMWYWYLVYAHTTLVILSWFLRNIAHDIANNNIFKSIQTSHRHWDSVRGREPAMMRDSRRTIGWAVRCGRERERKSVEIWSSKADESVMESTLHTIRYYHSELEY